MDRLSLLPNELLDDIFDLSHTLEHPLTRPLSKRLLPFFHRSFYRDIRLTTYEQLDRLCQTIYARSGLNSLVLNLRFELPDGEKAEDAIRRSEIEDPQIPTCEAILDLLCQLENLQKLRLQGSSRIARLFLDPPKERSFPFYNSLYVLQLAASFTSHGDPFDFLLSSSLSHFRALKTLTLDVSRPASTIASGAAAANAVQKVSNLSTTLLGLSLQGPLLASQQVARIVESAPALAELALLLDVAYSFTGMRQLLEHVQQPQRLRLLTLTGPSVDEVPADDLQPLQLFTKLRSITLDISVSLEDVVAALSKAPLHRITLGCFVDVKVDTLVKMVSGITMIRTLFELELNVITDAARGSPVSRVLAKEEMEKLNLEDLDWELPEWTDDFSRDGFKEFLALAKKEEIQVTGDTVEALKIEDEWEEEMEYYRSVMES
ncbi:hypothetical protein JCM5353_004831 [Sporobolomyces roseus]